MRRVSNHRQRHGDIVKRVIFVHENDQTVEIHEITTDLGMARKLAKLGFDYAITSEICVTHQTFIPKS